MAEVIYTDHDLLIITLERVDSLTRAFIEFKDNNVIELRDIKERVTLLERASDRQAGFFSGAKLIWAIVGAVPPALILLLRDVQF